MNNALSENSFASYASEREDLKLKNKDIKLLSKSQLQKEINIHKKEMEKAAKNLDFIQAAKLRDEIKNLKEHLKEH